MFGKPLERSLCIFTASAESAEEDETSPICPRAELEPRWTVR